MQGFGPSAPKTDQKTTCLEILLQDLLEAKIGQGER